MFRLCLSCTRVKFAKAEKQISRESILHKSAISGFPGELSAEQKTKLITKKMLKFQKTRFSKLSEKIKHVQK